MCLAGSSLKEFTSLWLVDTVTIFLPLLRPKTAKPFHFLCRALKFFKNHSGLGAVFLIGVTAVYQRKYLHPAPWIFSSNKML